MIYTVITNNLQRQAGRTTVVCVDGPFVHDEAQRYADALNKDFCRRKVGERYEAQVEVMTEPVYPK